ncbi:MAG TPA: hypothetical protein VGI79_08855 [Caulobacteraceae bacterium]|jgi:hypothetical protein
MSIAAQADTPSGQPATRRAFWAGRATRGETLTTTAASAVDASLAGAAPLGAGRLKIFLFGGLLLLLINFSAPMNGLIDIPVTFFLKNRMHLESNQLAVFKLWTGAPLFAGFMFGFFRDRWSPFGLGDRGHLMLFGGTTALIYGAVALLQPTYAVFLGGLFLATVTFQMAGSAANGLISTLGQRLAMAGQMSSLLNVAYALPGLVAYGLGGILSQQLESRNAVVAAQILFLIAASLMGAIALFGAFGPRDVFQVGHDAPPTASFGGDIIRILKHWPIYPAMTIQLLWQFAPGIGTVLQYHLTNTLHASDAQWGAWNAIFQAAFIPVYLAYGFLCQRVKLSILLWIGFALGTVQMVPMLFVHSAAGALIAAAPLGILGGIGQGALFDLTIRSAPKGLQGTTLMMFWAMFYISTRFGDLFGTWLYDHHGGFIPPFIATIVSTGLTLPVLLFVPKRLVNSTDGEALAL